MNECKKLKTKALIGLLLIMYIPFEKNFNFIESVGISISLGLFSIILGLFLIQPYWKCITDYNNMHKPPHS
jgi:hypothetical protein